MLGAIDDRISAEMQITGMGGCLSRTPGSHRHEIGSTCSASNELDRQPVERNPVERRGPTFPLADGESFRECPGCYDFACSQRGIERIMSQHVCQEIERKQRAAEDIFTAATIHHSAIAVQCHLEIGKC